jgi:hypothetical protein
VEREREGMERGGSKGEVWKVRLFYLPWKNHWIRRMIDGRNTSHTQSFSASGEHPLRLASIKNYLIRHLDPFEDSIRTPSSYAK